LFQSKYLFHHVKELLNNWPWSTNYCRNNQLRLILFLTLYIQYYHIPSKRFS